MIGPRIDHRKLASSFRPVTSNFWPKQAGEVAHCGALGRRRKQKSRAPIAFQLRSLRRWPQEETIPGAVTTLFNNITISGGVAPARAYIPGLLPDVLDGRIQLGRVFDRVVSLEQDAACQAKYRGRNAQLRKRLEARRRA